MISPDFYRTDNDLSKDRSSHSYAKTGYSKCSVCIHDLWTIQNELKTYICIYLSVYIYIKYI